MAITNNYITVGELKAALGIASGDTADDTRLETAILTACRLIDKKTGRRFYTTSAAETRAYTPDGYDVFYAPDDINAVTSLKTDADGDGTFETTWAATDYTLMPKNASLDSKPYTYVKLTPLGRYTFPKNIPNSLQIVGKFGWGATSAAPYEVRQASLLQAARIFKRHDAPFGVLGSGEFGQSTVLTTLDPDVEQLLIGVSRHI